MKIKNTIMSALAALTIFTTTGVAQAITHNEDFQHNANEVCEYVNPNYCGNSLTNGLQSNQTTLFYMHSDDIGHYFLDPLVDVDNIVYVGLEDYKVLAELEIDVDGLYVGKKFIGTFVDDTLWELEGLTEVVYE